MYYDHPVFAALRAIPTVSNANYPGCYTHRGGSCREGRSPKSRGGGKEMRLFQALLTECGYPDADRYGFMGTIRLGTRDYLHYVVCKGFLYFSTGPGCGVSVPLGRNIWELKAILKQGIPDPADIQREAGIQALARAQGLRTRGGSDGAIDVDVTFHIREPADLKTIIALLSEIPSDVYPRKS